MVFSWLVKSSGFKNYLKTRTFDQQSYGFLMVRHEKPSHFQTHGFGQFLPVNQQLKAATNKSKHILKHHFKTSGWKILTNPK